MRAGTQQFDANGIPRFRVTRTVRRMHAKSWISREDIANCHVNVLHVVSHVRRDEAAGKGLVRKQGNGSFQVIDYQ
jgi:hypothetical protein